MGPNGTKIILSYLKFSGDQLGPQYEFTFSLAGQIATIKVDMTDRREAALNREIFFIPESNLSQVLPITIEAKEIDEVFSDVGSLSAELRIAYPEPLEQFADFNVLVQGYGRERKMQSMVQISLIICLDGGDSLCCGPRSQ